jgi:hypothetical protein
MERNLNNKTDAEVNWLLDIKIDLFSTPKAVEIMHAYVLAV